MNVMRFVFEYVKNENIPWDILSKSSDHTVYKSKQWASFLEEYYKVKPFIISITENNNLIGYFYSQNIKIFGIKIIASPLEGWSTSYQGLSMLNQISVNKRLDIYEELIKWLFCNRYCSFFQVLDWQLEVPECAHREINFEIVRGYVLDLTKSEVDLYKNFSHSSVKYCIKKAIKNGIIVNEPKDSEEFSKEYFLQINEIFSKQGLKPTHSVEQTTCIMKHLFPNRVLALFALDSKDNTIATGFFPYDGTFGFLSGTTSSFSSRNVYPNEILMWEAIKILKNRGIELLEFGGGRRYKEKYGTKPYVKPRLIVAKYGYLLNIRKMLKFAYYKQKYFVSIIKGRKINIGNSKG